MAQKPVRGEFKFAPVTPEEAKRGLIARVVCSLCGERLRGIKLWDDWNLHAGQVDLHIGSSHDGRQ
jgi:hypothetical protein